MNGPPTGTVTFLFTDIEGSTKLWEDDAPAMQVALARHDDVLRSAMGEHAVTSSRPSATPSVSLSPLPLMPWKQPWKRSAGSSPPSGSRPGHLGLGWLCTRVWQRRARETTSDLP